MSKNNLFLSIFMTTLVFTGLVVADPEAEFNPKNKKIVIVGAGAAGIAAAAAFLTQRYENIQILEAQNYYGGRILPIYDEDNNRMELGAEMIEGLVGNTAYKILWEAGLAPAPVDVPTPKKSYIMINHKEVKSDSDIYVQSNGEDFPADDLRPFLDAITDTLEEVYKSNETLSEFYHKKFNEISDDQQKIGLALSFTQIYAETMSPASNWLETTGIGFGSKKKLNGVHRPVNGMKSVLDYMMDVENGTLNEKWKNILKLNSEVTKIDYAPSKPIVTYVDGVNNEKHEIEADYVIVTVSLGVLKEQQDNLFHPSLPETMIDAIQSFNFGLENKIFLKFSERWWPKGKDLHIIWRPEDKATLPLEDQWLPKVEVIMPKNEKTLMLYVMESEQYHTDDLTQEEIISKVMPVIRRAFANKGWDIKDPVKVYHSRWYANPAIRGALSYPTVMSHKKGLKHSDLAPKLKNQDGKEVLHFAGEATNGELFGGVNGAIDSGLKAAKDIVAYNVLQHS